MLLSIKDMNIEQKLGMLFCARIFNELNDDDMDFTIEMIKNHSLGSVQLPANRRDIIEKVLSAADYPILVFNDTEMGFPTSDLPKIPLMALAACDKEEYYSAFAKAIVSEAKACGYNGTWGPVIDILRCDGPCRVYRHLGDTPEKVSKAAEVIADVYRRNHYLSTGKHYPGAHTSWFDSHMTEGVSDATEEEIVNFDLVPYLDLMKKGLLPCVMTSHNVIKNIDPKYPASLSKKVIDLLRDRGYDGLIFTDSFAMMGILHKFGEKNIYGMAIAAGNDIVLPNFRHSMRESYNMLLQNYRDGAIPDERINDAVRHVLAAQAYVAKKPEEPTIFTEQDKIMLESVARDCVSAITDEGITAKLDGDNDEKLFIIVTENNFDPKNDDPETNVSKWYYPERIAKRIEEDFPGAAVEFLPEFSDEYDNDRVLSRAIEYKEVIFVSFCTTTSYLGTDSLTKRTEAVANCLIHSKKISAFVHFGNPYAMQQIYHVPRLILGYMIPDSQLYAIDALAGIIEPKGTVPYDIKFN